MKRIPNQPMLDVRNSLFIDAYFVHGRKTLLSHFVSNVLSNTLLATKMKAY